MPSKSWAGVRKMAPPTGWLLTPGTLTGMTMGSSKSCVGKTLWH
uniref:Uncharacterized protein n=1 Tax=Anguilla anguilla TaxID=7936 RepID=A0A0E9VVU3_ANGAN